MYSRTIFYKSARSDAHYYPVIDKRKITGNTAYKY